VIADAGRDSCRLGCEILERHVSIGYADRQFKFGFCCPSPGHENTPIILSPTDNPDDIAALFRSARESLIRSLGDPGHVCQDCRQLAFDAFVERAPLKVLQVGMPFPCNAKCFYCNNSYPKRLKYSEERKGYIDVFDFIALFAAFEKHALVDPHTVYRWASGEISIYKHSDRFFEFARRHTVAILSNAILFNQALADWFSGSRLRGEINVSLDCGTRNSFKRIKGVDAFDQVRRNVIQYGTIRAPQNILELKYVLCEGYNDNQDDIDGFFEIARRANATRVILDRNFTEVQKALSENMMAICEKFSDNAGKSGIELCLRQRFTKEQIKRLQPFATAPRAR
jgi:wyosine [tRNA(Phe)-imidazoG37] synthetase (radical SAM superfamily)